MKIRTSIIVLLIALLAVPVLAQAPGGTSQTPGQSGSAGSTDRGGATKDVAEQETQIGAFTVRGSVEVGYRFVDIAPTRLFGNDVGGESMYRTLVNLDEGPRVLEQTLHMRTAPENGILFDDLMLTSFGFGGDPEQSIRFRLGKSRWYNLGINMRQFQNYWDYSPFANPLNPVNLSTQGNLVAGQSPRRMENVHRFGDVGLTIAPAAPVSLRLGFSRVRLEGPSFSVNHEGTDPLLSQMNNTTSDNWQAGVDLKFLPKTVLAFDVFYQRYKQDTDWILAAERYDGFQFTTPTGIPTDIGVPFDPRTGVTFPCNNPFAGPPAGTIPTNCNQYLGYSRVNPYRTISPTGQVTLQSNFVKNLDIHGRFQYGESRQNGFYDEFARALVTRLGWNAWTVTGNHRNLRTSALGDLGVTVHLTDNLRWANQFRFYRWEIPSSFNYVENAWRPYTDATNIDPNTGLPRPANNILLEPDLANPDIIETFAYRNNLGENTKSFQTEVEADFTQFFGAHIGYRLTARRVSSRGSFLTEDIIEYGGEFTEPRTEESEGPEIAPNFDFNEHTAIGGFWFRPADPVRLSVNYEGTFAEDWMTRVSARQQHQARARLSWTPRDRYSFALYGNIWEARNGRSDIDYTGRNRNFGASVNVFPAENWNVDFSYNYNNALHSNVICYSPGGSVVTNDQLPTYGDFTPNSSTFIAPGSQYPCPMQLANAGIAGLGNAPYAVRGNFTDRNHFGSLNVMFRPLPRVNTSLGYSIVYVDGDQVVLNRFQPFGTLKSTYHRPLAALEIELTRQLSVKGSWNYWGYNERTPSGPIFPRDFHTNAETISLRYAF